MASNRSYQYTTRYQSTSFKKKSEKKRSRLWLFLGIWLLLMLLGGGLVMFRIMTPVTQVATPVSFPNESTLGRQADRANVLMFANPTCPSIQASLDELKNLSKDPNIRATVVFWEPNQSNPDWQESDTVKKAQSIPNTRVVIDRSGDEFRRFGINEPERVLVYDGRGQLECAGTVANSRQHLAKTRVRVSAPFASSSELASSSDSSSIFSNTSQVDQHSILAD